MNTCETCKWIGTPFKDKPNMAYCRRVPWAHRAMVPVCDNIPGGLILEEFNGVVLLDSPACPEHTALHRQRDRLEIASAAMAGILSNPAVDYSEPAEEAIKHADALLAELEKSHAD